MKIYKSLKMLLPVLALLAVSCSDAMIDDGGLSTDDTDSGVEGTITLHLSVSDGFEGDKASSRAFGSDEVDENSIKDFWFIEYNEGGRRVGWPQYHTLESQDQLKDLHVIVPNRPNLRFSGLIIANTHDPNLLARTNQANLDACDSIKKFSTAFYKDIVGPTSCITTGPDGNHYLPMSGSFDIYKKAGATNNEVSCRLRRNVVKMVLQIEVPSAEVKLVNGLWRNVPDRMCFLEHFNHPDYYETKDDDAAYKAVYSTYEGFYRKAMGATSRVPEITVQNWAEEKLDHVGANTVEMVYYLPRNVSGIHGTADDMRDKNRAATNLKATFFEINANAGNYQLRYRLYPGKDKFSDFNLLPNYCYTMPIVVRAPGDPETDSRVTNMNKVRLDESNSYIINPTANYTFAVPISRINYYWQNEGASQVINESDEWIAEVIWQDQPKQLISFYSYDNDPLPGNFEGKGDAAFYFRPIGRSEGNVVIGVRKKESTTPAPGDRKYLWSWHLWITGYEPDDNISPWEEGKYVYPVTGGVIHRYESSFWDKSYLNKYIMDRNLGAFSADPAANSRSFGLYYQFGRFAPMPYAGARVYDIKGEVIPDFCHSDTCNMKVEGPAQNISYAIQRPYTFFKCAATGTDQKWLASNSYDKNSWNNPNWHTSGTKSLFDPCPPGWRIPGDAVWENFRSYEVTHSDMAKTRFKAIADLENYPFDTAHGYYFYIDEAKPEVGKTWYPAAGKRNRESGGMTEVGTTGFYWMTMPASSNFGQCMDMNSIGIQLTADFSSHGGRSAACSVRCIRQ
ncbi:MAG: fibrobacter succinogenes major paralogous domain-containing protein [Duncaniella sp.]|nr:fibrobacter succinogenes major paralogous domain-containing protein [Duncaniella sp.]